MSMSCNDITCPYIRQETRSRYELLCDVGECPINKKCKIGEECPLPLIDIGEDYFYCSLSRCIDYD